MQNVRKLSKTIENSQKEDFRIIKKQPQWSYKDQNDQSLT